MRGFSSSKEKDEHVHVMGKCFLVRFVSKVPNKLSRPSRRSATASHYSADAHGHSSAAFLQHSVDGLFGFFPTGSRSFATLGNQHIDTARGELVGRRRRAEIARLARFPLAGFATVRAS